jgi:hypothetical protein
MAEQVRNRGVRGGLLAVLAALLLQGGLLAAEPKNYAYFFLQGKISDSQHRGALEGATVRLAAGGETWETTTDERGVFVFEKLPLQTYDLTVTAPDGQVIESLDRIDLPEEGRTRLRVRFGTGDGKSARLDAGGTELTGVEIKPSDRPPRWKRFWKQFGIFVGAAMLLAL